MVRDGIGDQNDTGSIVPKNDPRTKCFTKNDSGELSLKGFRVQGSGFKVQVAASPHFR